MSETLGLLAEARQIARDLGYRVREEPLGDLPGGACVLAGVTHVLLNLGHPASERLDLLLRSMATDPRLAAEPKSLLLESRLRSLGPEPPPDQDGR